MIKSMFRFLQSEILKYFKCVCIILAYITLFYHFLLCHIITYMIYHNIHLLPFVCKVHGDKDQNTTVLGNEFRRNDSG